VRAVFEELERPAQVPLQAVGVAGEEEVEGAGLRRSKPPRSRRRRQTLMHAIYDRITVTGPEIVGVRLMQAACAHGLALRCPKSVNWRARQVSGAR
jgi:hypothetical protein